MSVPDVEDLLELVKDHGKSMHPDARKKLVSHLHKRQERLKKASDAIDKALKGLSDQ